MKKQTFCLKSTLRKSFESINNIQHFSPIGNVSIKDMRINEFCMRNTIYNVNSNNNTLSLTYLTTTYQITLTNGFYLSSLALLSELKTKLDACGSTLVFTCSANTTNYLVTISSTANFTLTFPNSRIQRLLGFVSASSYTGTTTYTGSQPYDLQYTDYIQLNIRELGFTIEIHNNVDLGSLITYKNNDLNMLNAQIHGLNTITISLLDQYGLPLQTYSDYFLRLSME